MTAQELGRGPAERAERSDGAGLVDLVRSVLERPEGRRWVVQDFGLVAVRLDDDRVHRLHLWDPDADVGDLVVHDHPFDFASTVVTGAITNTLYVEDPAGEELRRERYSPADEDDRLVDSVRLTATATTYVAGQRYTQRADELHSSAQEPGTVTALRWTRREVSRLTVCRRADQPWTSGRSRPADPAEVRRLADAALTRLG